MVHCVYEQKLFTGYFVFLLPRQYSALASILYIILHAGISLHVSFFINHMIIYKVSTALTWWVSPQGWCYCEHGVCNIF